MSNEPTKADLKAILASAGQELHPDASVRFLDLPAPGERAMVVILERVTAGYTPPYCVHGYATCVRCASMCYLGSETQKMCADQQAYALCKRCADKLADEGDLTPDQLAGNAHDHLRNAGPH